MDSCHSYAMHGKTWSPVSEWAVSTNSEIYIDLSILVFLRSRIGKIIFKGSI